MAEQPIGVALGVSVGLLFREKGHLWVDSAAKNVAVQPISFLGVRGEDTDCVFSESKHGRRGGTKGRSRRDRKEGQKGGTGGKEQAGASAPHGSLQGCHSAALATQPCTLSP